MHMVNVVSESRSTVL